MTAVAFTSHLQINGCRVLRLESDLLRVDVLPECGGKILHIVHKPENRDYLWQHPITQPAILPDAADYDDNWCGGWDDCLPSVGAATHGGIAYPDHGEFWTRICDWQAHRADDAITLHLQSDGYVTPTRLEKTITLTAGSPAVQIRHKLTNRGELDLDVVWSQHPALSVGPTHEFVIPATRGIVGSPGMARLADAAGEFTWPHVPGRDGNVFDYRPVPDRIERSGYEMLFLTPMDAGWCAVRDRATRSGIGFAFETRVFKHLWLFQARGGWRDLHVAVLEPATGWPTEVDQAAANGSCLRLGPGQIIDTRTTAVIFTGREGVGGIDLSGNVSG